MKQIKKSKLHFLFFILALVVTVTLTQTKANAHHDPVRPGTYPSFNWRNPYGWYSDPNRPRRTYVPRRDVGGYPNVGSSGGSYETFVIPHSNPMSWGDASRLCDRDGGTLSWQRNRKVCIKRF